MDSSVWSSTLVGVLVCVTASAAQAQESPLSSAASASASGAAPRSPADIDRDVKTYCRYVEAVGNSSAALLLSPALFAEFSNIPGSSVITAKDSLARLQVGVSLSPLRMYRGFVTNDLAHAECRRYSAQAHTPATPASPVIGRAGISAKIQVLEEAVRHGRELRVTLAKKLEASLATVEDYGALALQVDGLEQQLRDVKEQLAALPPATVSDTNAWAERAKAEDAAEELQARLRTSEALQLDIRGGYYKLFGEQQRVPAFVIATLEFNPGWLWQGPAEARARKSHDAWIKAKSSVIELAPEIRARLQQVLQSDRERLVGLNETLANMELYRANVQAVPGEQSRRFADVLWLELAKLRAEKAFLMGDVDEISELLSTSGRHPR